MATNLNKIIEEETCEFIYDDCNLKPTQYFNGTCKENQGIIYSSHNSNIIYSFRDMGYSKNDFIHYLTKYCDYRTYDSSHVSNISTLLFSLTNKEYHYNNKKFYVNDEVRDISEITISELNVLNNTLSSINPEMEKQPHLDYDTKYDNEYSTLDIDEIPNEETEIDLYDLDIDFWGDEADGILKTSESESEHDNQEESTPSMSDINDEFDKFQEDLSVREKRLKTFVRFEIDDEPFNLIDELNGISYS